MEEAQARQELLIARVKDREAVKQKELEERLRLEAQRRTHEERLRAEAEKKLADLQSLLATQERRKAAEAEEAATASCLLQEKLQAKLRDQERAQEVQEASARAHAQDIERLRAFHLEEMTALLAEQKKAFSKPLPKNELVVWSKCERSTLRKWPLARERYRNASKKALRGLNLTFS
jgi:hypothetical protein